MSSSLPSLRVSRWYSANRSPTDLEFGGDWRTAHPFENLSFADNMFGRATSDELYYIQDLLCNHEYYLDIFGKHKESKGGSPGPDGKRFSDFSKSECAEILRGIASEIRAGSYTPGRTRRVEIPKPGGGLRKLGIRNVIDRVIESGLYMVLVQAIDPVFFESSYAYRPGRCYLDMLFAVERNAVQHEMYAVATDDARNAYDNVPINEAVANFREFYDDDWLVGHITGIIRGRTDSDRIRGLEQGGAMSPLTFNLFMHNTLDRHITTRSHATRLLRYADNIVMQGTDCAECEQSIVDASNLLESTGLSLKGVTVVDVRSEPVELLGFLLDFCDGQPRYRLCNRAFRESEESPGTLL